MTDENIFEELDTSQQMYDRIDKALTSAEIAAEAKTPADMGQVDALLGKAEGAYSALEASNKDLLAGKLPDDVVGEIKRRSAEMSSLQGLGVGRTTADRTLRDLGLTSMQAMQQGQQVQQAVAAGYGGLGEIRERTREFNSSFAQSAQQLLQAERQQQLAGVAAGTQHTQFRSTLSSNVYQFQTALKAEINSQILGLTQFREDLLMKYTHMDKREEFANSATTIDDVLSKLGNLSRGI